MVWWWGWNLFLQTLGKGEWWLAERFEHRHVYSPLYARSSHRPFGGGCSLMWLCTTSGKSRAPLLEFVLKYSRHQSLILITKDADNTWSDRVIVYLSMYKTIQIFPHGEEFWFSHNTSLTLYVRDLKTLKRFVLAWDWRETILVCDMVIRETFTKFIRVQMNTVLMIRISN